MINEFQLGLPDLLFFVKTSCHENLHAMIKCVEEMIDRNLFPKKLSGFLKKFIPELRDHLMLEEHSFFPSIAYSQEHRSAHIDHLVDDHDRMREGIMKIREFSQNFAHPGLSEEAVVTLREMERIILNHIQIENHVLFPMVLSAG